MTTAAPTAHTLTRDCRVLQIPSGEPFVLPAGTRVILTQSLGGTYTIQAPNTGGLFRLDGKDADALGLETVPSETGPAAPAGPVDEKAVWDQLRTCYDPEIPVNIVDLGLVYDLSIGPHPEGGSRVDVKMTITAPGCGMGTAIAADAREKIARLPGVKETEVQVVWDPPWSAGMISEEGRRILGIQ